MRFIKSYASDFINGVGDGQVLTPKHFLLGFALHSITGQKKHEITDRLGHSMNYDKVIKLKLHKRRNLRSFWILLNYLYCPSNQQLKMTVY